MEARTNELQESLEHQTAISKVLQAISTSPGTLSPVYESMLSNALECCDAKLGMLFSRNGDIFHVAAHRGYPPEVAEMIAKTPDYKAEECGLHYLVKARVASQIEDMRDQRFYKDGHLLTVAAVEQIGARTALGVPLIKDGEVTGAFVFLRLEKRLFSQKEIDLVTNFAQQAVIAMENARLLDELQTRQMELARSVDELRSLGEVGKAVNATLDMGQVLQTVLENACKMAYAGGGTIYVYDIAIDAFQLEAGYNMSEEHIQRVRAQPIRMGDPIVGECGARREVIQHADLTHADGPKSPLVDILLRAGVRAILAMPLIHQDAVIGALVVRRTYPGAFSPETVRLLEAFAAQSAIAVNNARLFKEIEDKSRQIELASQHKSQFLANMSHELRTPLNAILGYTELMQDGIYGELPGKAASVLGRVQSNSRHLLGLINSVLDLSKIEAGQLVLNLAEYSMGSVIETVVVATEALTGERQLALKTEIAKDLPSGIGDEQRIAQVLLNLVGNAIKFTEAGEVRIAAETTGECLLVSVSDTGPGIPADEHARIFEEFHQVDSSNTKVKGGTGLGLAIAKRIIEMHGGHIWVESELGRGSTFRFEIPVTAHAVKPEPLRGAAE